MQQQQPGEGCSVGSAQSSDSGQGEPAGDASVVSNPSNLGDSAALAVGGIISSQIDCPVSGSGVKMDQLSQNETVRQREQRLGGQDLEIPESEEVKVVGEASGSDIHRTIGAAPNNVSMADLAAGSSKTSLCTKQADAGKFKFCFRSESLQAQQEGDHTTMKQTPNKEHQVHVTASTLMYSNGPDQSDFMDVNQDCEAAGTADDVGSKPSQLPSFKYFLPSEQPSNNSFLTADPEGSQRVPPSDIAQTCPPAALDSAQTFSLPAVDGAQTSSPVAVESAQTCSLPAVDGAQTYSPVAVESAQTCSLPAVDGAQTSSPVAVESAQTCSLPAVDSAQTSPRVAVESTQTTGDPNGISPGQVVQEMGDPDSDIDLLQACLILEEESPVASWKNVL